MNTMSTRSVGAERVADLTRVAFWIAVALAFGVWVAVAKGAAAAAEYYAAYLLEFSLSVDNIFVSVIVFSELHVPAEHQRRVLGWGIAGALVFRRPPVALLRGVRCDGPIAVSPTRPRDRAPVYGDENDPE